MKNLFKLFALVAVGLTFTLSSCVTKGKFLTAEAEKRRLQDDSAETHKQLAGCRTSVKDLEDQRAALQAKNAAVQNDLQNVSSSSQKSLAESSMTIAQQAKRLKDLQDLIQAQKDVMNKLKKSIADALVNFKPDELSVYIKDGNVYVSLAEKLLFKSGSAAVDPKGKQALGNLATVLNTTADVTVMIEGHTDTVPIRKDKYEDNWELSTERANSIVRILTKDYSVDPHTITAAGRGEFHPIASNENNEGKASNRRTEIILSPNLSELYKLLGQ